MIKCKCCKEKKYEGEFYRTAGTLSGHQGSCKECIKEKRKARYAKQQGKVYVPDIKEIIEVPEVKLIEAKLSLFQRLIKFFT